MLQFPIFGLLILHVGRCLTSDDFQTVQQIADVELEVVSTPLNNEDALKKLLLEFGKHSNIADELTLLEETCSEGKPDSEQGFEYQVQSEVFESPVLNKMLQFAQEKISHLAQIFEDDLRLVVDNAKSVISRRLEEKLSSLQEDMDGVRRDVQQIANKDSLRDFTLNLFVNIKSNISSQNISDIDLSNKEILIDMTNAVGDQIKIMQDGSYNEKTGLTKSRNPRSTACKPREEQIEDGLASVKDSEGKIAQVKESLVGTAVTECPLLPKHLLSSLESATEVEQKLLLNVSAVLESTQSRVLSYIEESVRKFGMGRNSHQMEINEIVVQDSRTI